MCAGPQRAGWICTALCRMTQRRPLFDWSPGDAAETAACAVAEEIVVERLNRARGRLGGAVGRQLYGAGCLLETVGRPPAASRDGTAIGDARLAPIEPGIRRRRLPRAGFLFRHEHRRINLTIRPLRMGIFGVGRMG